MVKNFEDKVIPLWLIITIVILLFSSYFFASDMYVPSLPSITQDLHASSQLARATIAAFMISLALSQLFYGPASDKFGRKPVIIFGIVIYILGSVVCMLSQRIEILLCGRVIQGVGVGALASLSRTVIQDSVDKERFVHIAGWLSLFFMLAPVTAPVLGGIIETHFNWRITFVLMLIFALLVLFLVVFIMPETHHQTKRDTHALNISKMLKNY